MPEMTCTCPHCSQDLNVDTGHAGQVVACPQCAGEFTVPDAPAAAPQMAPAPVLVVPPSPRQQPQPQQQGYSQAPAQPAYQGHPAQQAAPPVQGYAPPYQPGTAVGIGAVFADPLEGQPRFIGSAPPGKLAGWAWGFAAAWIVGFWLISWRIGSSLLSSLPGVGGSAGRWGGEIKMGHHIEWIVSAALPLAILVIVLLSLKAMAGKTVPFGAILFTGSMVTLPVLAMGLFIMLISFLEIKTSGGAKAIGHITVILAVAAFSFLILLVKASLVSVLGYTRKAAFWLVPVVLLVVGYLTSWAGGLVGEISK
jgi:hypothetical protein